jgi:hypothetical protein
VPSRTTARSAPGLPQTVRKRMSSPRLLEARLLHSHPVSACVNSLIASTH